MTLYEFIKIVKSTAVRSVYVNEVAEGDVYENLNSGNHKYPFVNLTIDNISTVGETSTVSFNLFYIDRLEDDNKNKTQIQSFGVTVLSLIFNQLEETYNISFTSKTYTPFTEQFSDLCAGCYATCSVDFQADEICADEGSFESKTLKITENGLQSVEGYDAVDVQVNSADLSYYWIMPYNYGVPKISLSDATTTFEMKFRLREINNGQVIYDDGYTSLIYDDDQYKARLNGGPWLETLIRESDSAEVRTIKLTGTKLQIGYYLFTLEDGGHQWSYDQQLYIGYSPDYDNIGNIEVYNCKLYWDNGDFANYEPVVYLNVATLRDVISGDEMIIREADSLSDDLDGWYNNGIVNVNTGVALTSRDDVIEYDFIPLNTLYTNASYRYIYNKGTTGNSNICTIQQYLKSYALAPFVSYPAGIWKDADGNNIQFEPGIRHKVVITSEYSYLDGQQAIGKNSGTGIPTGNILLCDTGVKAIIFNFKIIKNGKTVVNIVPKKYTGTNTHILYDTVNDKVIAETTYGVLPITLEAPDVHTVTLSDEEYQAIMPILSEMRGEEYVDNTPKPVVD